MNIDEAARATRAFFYSSWNGLWDAKVWQVFTSSEHVAASKGFSSRDEAQAACDRLNLRAVLEAIRDTSLDSHRRAVLDAIIEDVGK